MRQFGSKQAISRRLQAKYRPLGSLGGTQLARYASTAPKLTSRAAKLAVKPSGNWSSSADNLVRNEFMNEQVRLWNMFEAAISANNLARAEPLFFSIAEAAATTPRDLQLAINSYLLKLVDTNAGSPIIAQSWKRRIQSRLGSKYTENGITEAILLKNSALGGESFLNMFCAEYPDELPEILSHPEVLGVPLIIQICESTNTPETLLNQETQNLIKLYRESQSDENPAADDQLDNGMMPSVVKPGVPDLIGTDSSNSRIIRHSLSGLTQSSTDIQKHFPFLAERLGAENLEDTIQSCNFFEIRESLSPEDQIKFDEELSVYNEIRQDILEQKSVEAAAERWKQIYRAIKSGEDTHSHHRNHKLEVRFYEWHQAMMPRVLKEFELMKELNDANVTSTNARFASEAFKKKQGPNISNRIEYMPFLMLADPETLPTMVLMELLKMKTTTNLSEGTRVGPLVSEIGANVENEFRLRAAKERESKALSGFSAPSKRAARMMLNKLKEKARNLSVDGTDDQSWSEEIKAKVGSLLLSMLLDTAKITVHGTDPISGDKVSAEAPAFYHTYRYRHGARLGVICPHKAVTDQLSAESIVHTIHPQLLPMLAEPKPWDNFTFGDNGKRAKLVRTRGCAEQIAYVKAAAEREKINKVYAGLNVLGKTGWTINKDIFNILSKIWNSGVHFLDIPAAGPAQPLERDLPKKPLPSEDPDIRRDYMRVCRRLFLACSSNYSQRCDISYKMDIARAYIGERFYLPHNMDFRGRAYPLSPHLNHLGNDLSRSLLLFWKGRELGPNGLKWLKVHATNLYGRKGSLDEREKFIDDNFDEIVKSVEDPIGGPGFGKGKFWQTAEHPLQFLATTMEIVKAVNSGNPETFVSHIAVHADGSCNGLQHYAALGGDPEGAHQVNLDEAERPQDVYTKVMDIVKEKVKKDCELGMDEAIKVLPIMSRKLVKQTVMTHVYGVTFVGARDQIAARMREMPNFQSADVFKCAIYLAGNVLDAVRELFYSAHQIQDWLGECAGRITKSISFNDQLLTGKEGKLEHMASLIWTTPLGLPIVQPYRRKKRRQINTVLQTVFIVDPHTFQHVDPRKQKNAFPPNFIHSLDATHMLMCATKSHECGLDFASVHDSFWTHAADMDVLNKNIRESFVTLYQRPIISLLKREFETRYKNFGLIIDIDMDSPIAKRITAARKRWLSEHPGTKGNPAWHLVQMDMERQEALRNGEEYKHETSLSIMEELSNEELEQLMAANIKPARAKKYKSVGTSSEFEGSGLELKKDEGTEDVEDTALEEEPKKPRARYTAALVPLRFQEPPKRGNFDVQEVMKSKYFFS